MNRVLKSGKIMSAFAVLIALTSCEGGTTFTKAFENNSSETITVTVYTSHSSSTTTILPKAKKTIWTDDRERGFVGDEYTCVSEIDSVVVSISNNKTLVLDVMNAGNWMRKSKDGRNAREDCTIAVSDSDLQ